VGKGVILALDAERWPEEKSSGHNSFRQD